MGQAAEKFEAVDNVAETGPVRVDWLHLFAGRDQSPLGTAFVKGKLEIGSHEYIGADRYRAGCIYRTIWDAIHDSGGAGGMKERVNSSPRTAGEQEGRAIARDLLKQIEARLSAHGRFILRQFLGEGSTAADAVKARCAGFEKVTWHAICLYLDELADAVVALNLVKHQFNRIHE